MKGSEVELKWGKVNEVKWREVKWSQAKWSEGSRVKWIEAKRSEVNELLQKLKKTEFPTVCFFDDFSNFQIDALTTGLLS